MSLKEQPALRVLLSPAGPARLPANQDSFTLVAGLLEHGYAVSVQTGPEPAASQDGGPVVVLRTEKAEEANGRNIDGLNADQVLALVDQARTEARAATPGEWKPWFPVIDYQRCTNCMQCLSFCLFGVYGVDAEQRITVQSNDNCKTNCPACSRVCPEAAILFPKYKSGPINGDVVSDADLQREKMKIDISALLGGDVYAMLRQRSERAQSRFSKERDSNKALEERKKCLTKLAQTADIPPEVLMSLPSPDEIARRAEEAKAKAQAALGQAATTSQS